MFAIVRTEASDFDVARVTQDLGERLGLNAVDLAQRFSKSPGILFDSVNEAEAQSCMAVLKTHGVSAETLPQSKIVRPAVSLIASCRLSDLALQHGSKSIPWGEMKWIDLVYVASEQTQRSGHLTDQDTPLSKTYSPDDSFFGGRRNTDVLGESFRQTGSLPRTTTRHWTPFLDIVGKSHSEVLRIDLSRFNFRSTGQKVHASREQNIWSLCIGLVSAASSADCGVGVRWIREGGLPHRQRVWGEEHHQHLLSWHLTRIANWSTPPSTAFHERSEPADTQAAKLNELVQLCQTILEDGKISLDEIKDLLRWLRAHRNLDIPAVRSLVDVMQRITADKVVTPEEKAELQVVLQKMLGDEVG